MNRATGYGAAVAKIVNGQKVFTTGAHDADYIWLSHALFLHHLGRTAGSTSASHRIATFR